MCSDNNYEDDYDHDDYDDAYDTHNISSKINMRDNKLVKSSTKQTEEQKRLLAEKIKYQKENKQRKIEATKKRKVYEKEQQIIYNNIKKQLEELQELEESQKIKENEMNSVEIEEIEEIEENKEIDDWESLY